MPNLIGKWKCSEWKKTLYLNVLSEKKCEFVRLDGNVEVASNRPDYYFRKYHLEKVLEVPVVGKLPKSKWFHNAKWKNSDFLEQRGDGSLVLHNGEIVTGARELKFYNDGLFLIELKKKKLPNYFKNDKWGFTKYCISYPNKTIFAGKSNFVVDFSVDNLGLKPVKHEEFLEWIENN